jgi:hypothetical protein
MKKTILFRSLVIALTAWLWIGHASTADAHSGPPRVEVGAEQVSPGATLEVRGINIAPEQRVVVTLVGPNADFPLGVAVGDAHGDFTRSFVLPPNLAAGAYSIRAAGENQVIVGVSLTIIGAGGSSDSEDATQRGADEPLLVPQPQGDPAVGEQPPDTSLAANVLAPAADADAESTLRDSSMRLAIGMVVLLVLVLGLAVAIRRRMAGIV